MADSGPATALKTLKPKTLRGEDERLARTGWMTRLLRRPESGVACGLIATFVIFALLPGAESL